MSLIEYVRGGQERSASDCMSRAVYNLEFRVNFGLVAVWDGVTMDDDTVDLCSFQTAIKVLRERGGPIDHCVDSD